MADINKYLNIHKDKVYLKLTLFFFLIWIFCKGPLRSMATGTSLESGYLLGLAPNFFAGIALVFWQTYMTSSRPIVTFFCIAVVLAIGEFVQLYMSTQTADLMDIFASLGGCALATGFIILRSRKEA